MNDLPILISFLKVVGLESFFSSPIQFLAKALYYCIYLRTLICLEYKNGGGGAFHISNHSES